VPFLRVRELPYFGFLAFCFLEIVAQPVSASMTMFLSEPIGSFGTMLPAGHAGISL
jgi:hypothetical protein